jgi:hypothetical protein
MSLPQPSRYNNYLSSALARSLAPYFSCDARDPLLQESHRLHACINPASVLTRLRRNSPRTHLATETRAFPAQSGGVRQRARNSRTFDTRDPYIVCSPPLIGPAAESVFGTGQRIKHLTEPAQPGSGLVATTGEDIANNIEQASLSSSRPRDTRDF